MKAIQHLLSDKTPDPDAIHAEIYMYNAGELLMTETQSCVLCRKMAKRLTFQSSPEKNR